jgi:GNAT superfamily N-acetyltransferase
MSEIKLERAPFPSSYFRETAIIQCLAFSNHGLTRWWAPTEADAITDTPEQIPPLRLHKSTREHIHRELDPSRVTVCAIIDGQVAGVATWKVPTPLRRSETLAELVYRKGIEYKDALEDWLFPSWWYIHSRRDLFSNAQDECMDKYLGKGNIDEMWYLAILCVNPKFQRRGVGAALVDWGLTHARARGEKAYLEASPFGKPLYIKKGFKVVGDLVVGEGDDQLNLPCMLWDPATAPSDQEIAHITEPSPVEKQA